MKKLTNEQGQFLINLANNRKDLVTNWKQFHHCNAYVSNCINNRYFLVKSYNTIVAIVDDQQGEFIEFGKYSRTTSAQVTKIHNELFSDTMRLFTQVTNW